MGKDTEIIRMYQEGLICSGDFIMQLMELLKLNEGQKQKCRCSTYDGGTCIYIKICPLHNE